LSGSIRALGVLGGGRFPEALEAACWRQVQTATAPYRATLTIEWGLPDPAHDDRLGSAAVVVLDEWGWGAQFKPPGRELPGVHHSGDVACEVASDTQVPLMARMGGVSSAPGHPLPREMPRPIRAAVKRGYHELSNPLCGWRRNPEQDDPFGGRKAGAESQFAKILVERDQNPMLRVRPLQNLPVAAPRSSFRTHTTSWPCARQSRNRLCGNVLVGQYAHG